MSDSTLTKDQFAKHTVSTDALDTLGNIISGGESRDAIHLAVDPIEAGTTLAPGDHVVIKEGKAVRAPGIGKGVGIVDPFLQDVVKKGDWFWLVVYPRTITALHHVWEHPDFAAADTTGKGASERWLRNFVDQQGVHAYEDDQGTTFDQFIDAALRAPGYGYMTLPFDGNGSLPPEFWTHVERYTGTKIPQEGRTDYFSCAC